VPAFVGDGGTGRILVLGAIHVTLAFVCHSAWATLLGVLRTWFTNPLVTRTLGGVTATALVWFGIWTLMAA
jgi:threonine/homoserine/homoserine lactone efflux protein